MIIACSKLRTILRVSKKIGYSRLVRWVLAIAPASKVVLFDPVKTFLFRHIKEDEGLMRYADSVGILSPEIKHHGSSTDLFGMGELNRTFFHRYSSTTMNTSSQVGLAFDSPEPSRQDLKNMVSTYHGLKSMVSTDISSISDISMSKSESIAASPLSSRPGILTTANKTHIQPSLIPMSRSPSKNRRSVHFGFLDTDTTNNDSDLTSHGDFSATFS